MRSVRVAITVCVLCLCGRLPATAAAGTLPLHECRLEHPLE